MVSLDDRDLQLLEFHKIREILAGFTSFSASHQLALEISPVSDGKNSPCV
jgi:dsDNA-specific endonuclease/ATPase MutS2